MKQILDENNNVIHQGDSNDMELAFAFLTEPFYILAQKRGLKMKDAYELNVKYWSDKAKKAKEFKLVNL